jgi:hypothetical protein
MSYSDQKSSQIEREIEQDRRRIEERIGAIQEKLSPGQLIDEMLAYAKGHGGAEFASNLKNSAVSNPLPVALISVGLAWLMAKPAHSTEVSRSNRVAQVEYPLAPITGDVRRSRSAVMEGESRYSHFEDSAGRKFKALADEAGRRAGHFVDEGGNTFRGFVDASGQQIDRIKDETGNLLDEASGWAQRAWTALTDAVDGARTGISDGGRSISQTASSAYDSMNHQSARFNEMVQTAFRDQPLIGGALAFAFGAAIGAALPRTEQENAVMGDMASKVKKDMTTEAEKVLDKGSEVAAQAYDRASSVASELHDIARDRIGEEFGKASDAEEVRQRHH